MATQVARSRRTSSRAGRAAGRRRCGYTFRGKTCRASTDHFCEGRAARAVAVFEEVLVHTKGDFARQAFILADWQADEIILPVFGTVIWDEHRRRYVRRYRIVWIELARKNGKSELLAGIALILLCFDDEEGAEIYGTAKDTKQAAKVWAVAERMVKLSKLLSDRLRINQQSKRIVDEATGSFYEIITGDAAGELGHNPHGIVFDEVLTQRKPDLWNSLRTGMGTRAQPLMVAASTAGDEPGSFFDKQHNEMVRVAADPARAPHVFTYIRNMPLDADPFDEANWPYPNPALDDFLDRRALREEALEAQNDASKENAFRQFRGNQHVRQVVRYIPMDAWAGRMPGTAGNIQMAGDIEGRACMAGLDVASEQGLLSFQILVPDDDEPTGYDIVSRYWMPGENIEDREHRDGAPYREWAKSRDVLKLTDGTHRDIETIKADILELASRYEIEQIGYRRTGAIDLVLALGEEGLTVVPIGSTAAALNDATVALKDWVMAGRLRHGENPALRWEADALAVKKDGDGNLKPDQSHTTVPLPGMLALVRAIDRTLRSTNGGESAYEEHGLVIA